MFFSITSSHKINFPYQWNLGTITLFTDAGWNTKTTDRYTVVYKGYADDFDLAENIESIIAQDRPRYTGSFCAIIYDHTRVQLTIKTDVWRSFPIFLHDDEVTNLDKSDRIAWTDSLISIDQDFEITEEKFDAIGHITDEPLSLDQALAGIDDLLQKKTKKFLGHNRLPIKAHLSGGIDSLLVTSMLIRNAQHYEIVKASHFDYDRFWLANDSQIQDNFWAYKQLHHWTDPCLLVSGAPGDEFMLRSPTTIDQLIKYRGQSTLDILQNSPHTLHSDYFNKPKHIEIFQQQSVDRDLATKDFYRQLCHIVLNDWQHWHLGHTLTWTPLRDLEIFKILLRLEHQSAIDQMFDSQLSKSLIEINSPGMSRLISDQKNSLNPMKNLSDWLFQDAR